MTLRWITEIVLRWIALYTRGLPEATAARRREEIAADLHDHVAAGRARGTADARLAVAIAARMLRGAGADIAWRTATVARARSTRGATAVSPSNRRSATRIARVTGAVLLVALVANQVSGEWVWTAFDFALVAVLLCVAGVLLELMLRHRSSWIVRAIAIALGLAAMAAGQADDAPGLGAFGLLLIAATVAMTLRARPAAGA